jgi:uncharacterized protein YyaL (SSP411 family)
MANRLAQETSPYLRQHRDNPVDWYAWGDEAFARAQAEDKPILLSIGYSACHWCHVMAHESFEDDATAALMNELFVNVKVDREERPDVDAVYMDAVQAMTGHGGWPMTVFLLPDGAPFYGGTYFPKVGRQGMPSFTDLCRAIDQHYRDNRSDVADQAARLTEAVSRSAALVPGEDLPPPEVVETATTDLLGHHDAAWGGFGHAPKFPQSMSLDLLLRVHATRGRDDMLPPVVASLDAMAAGGIYDQLGGGFARYSVDNRWLVPHFEKMLYDQALLTRVYLHAWQLTGEDRHLQIVEETIEYVRRDLRHESGGIHSAEDADSEGVEGKFYVWSTDEITDVVGADAAPAVLAWYGATPDGNFEGANILMRPERGVLQRPPTVEEARAKLFERREDRVRPGLDDKVLTEWNALMVASLAEAASATGRADWLREAEETGQFLLDHLRRSDGRWLRSWQAGDGERVAEARHLAYAVDHAALVEAFTRLAEASGRAHWIQAARTTADALLDLFWDDEAGGLFTTGHDAERLVARQKDFLDNATPSANSTAAAALLRLAALTGIDRYRQRAEDILVLFGTMAEGTPNAFAHLLSALDMAHRGLTEVVVTGDRPDLVAVVTSRYRPDTVLAWGEPYDSPLWEGRGDGRAYVCENFTCQLPADTAEALTGQLDIGKRA